MKQRERNALAVFLDSVDADAAGTARVSDTELSERMRCSERTAQYAVSGLVERGRIEVSATTRAQTIGFTGSSGSPTSTRNSASSNARAKVLWCGCSAVPPAGGCSPWRHRSGLRAHTGRPEPRISFHGQSRPERFRAARPVQRS